MELKTISKSVDSGNPTRTPKPTSASGSVFPTSSTDTNDAKNSDRSKTINSTTKRLKWDKKLDFLLSVIGFAVDLANVWRFPYLCLKNGGGAFLIPYVIMVVFAGVPLFYMELALGQYYRRGAITTWGHICPLFKGVGVCVTMISWITDIFYKVIIAWGFYFLVASFQSPLLWSSCDNWWNSYSCYETERNTSIDECWPILNNTNQTGMSSAGEYFYKRVLGLSSAKSAGNTFSSTTEHPGKIQWELALCLLTVYIITFFSLWNGVKTSGKVVWFTATFPYVTLFILLIRGATLPGAMRGIEIYVKPNISRLANGDVWIDAASQVMFSLGPGFGVLMALSSYNDFNNNIYRDALITTAVNGLTSFMCGFVIFAVLGYMSCISGRPVTSVAGEGPGLVFVVYPLALSTMPISAFWSVIFFLMILTVGFDTTIAGSESVITALQDEFPLLKKYRKIFTGCLFGLNFLIGLVMCTKAGMLFVEWFGYYGASWGLLFAVLCETLVVSWIYGFKRFSSNIEEMLGSSPGLFWIVSWTVSAPLYLLATLIYGWATWVPLQVQAYRFPPWMNGVGWVLSVLPLLAIFIIAVFVFIKTPGDSFRQKLRISITPLPPPHTSE